MVRLCAPSILPAELGDWEAVERMIDVRQNQQSIPPELHRQMKERLISGIGTFPIIGSADRVAETLKQMSDARLDGMAVGLINYINELPFVEGELLPRMARLGLRGRASIH
jgi:dimethylsulfone monooxygenase